MVAFDRSRSDVERYGGRSVEIIAGPIVTDGRAAVAGSEKREIRFGIIVPGDPY